MILSKIDLVAVLSKYGVDTTKKLLKVLSKDTPLAHNETYYVELDGIKYRVLADDTANNKVDYILKQFNHSQKELQGSLSSVPNDGLCLEYDGHDVYLFTEYVPVRLDTYLAKNYPEYSRSQWRKYCDAGYALVNGVAKAPKTLLKFTDKVTTELPEPVSYSDHTLPIVYEDDDVIVIDKPVGTLTHAKGAVSEEFTVADFASFRTTDGLDTNRPGIVHRLDRATSGILIIAKHTEAKRHLQKQFQDRKAKKTYLAIAHNVPKNPEAIIRLPIERNPLKPQTFRIGSSGKYAETAYNLLATYNKGQYSLLELKPLTGRTHQLRVHLDYIGCPIVGDTLYGGNKDTARLMLHAKELEITTPSKERKTFSIEPPADFTDFLQALNQDS